MPWDLSPSTHPREKSKRRKFLLGKSRVGKIKNPLKRIEFFFNVITDIIFIQFCGQSYVSLKIQKKKKKKRKKKQKKQKTIFFPLSFPQLPKCWKSHGKNIPREITNIKYGFHFSIVVRANVLWIYFVDSILYISKFNVLNFSIDIFPIWRNGKRIP